LGTERLVVSTHGRIAMPNVDEEKKNDAVKFEDSKQSSKPRH
jgi:hypothetical protein